MFTFIPSAQKLDARAKKALQNGELPINKVREIQAEVVAHHKVAQKGFRRAFLIVIGVFLLMTALSIPQMGTAMLVSMLITGIALVGILLFMKWFYVDAVKRQFVQAVTQGYPNFDLSV